MKFMEAINVLKSVAEVVPLKQGLKHDLFQKKWERYGYSCRGSSIKTRIETTTFQFLILALKQFVAEVVPLKQGLKPYRLLSAFFDKPCCRGSSIKTRIETEML